MSKEIGPYQYQTGVTDLKGALRNAAGQVRNVSGATIDTFEAWADGSIDDYDFAFTEDGTSGDYYADLPAGLLTSTTYHVTPFRGTATLANYRNTKEPGCLVGPGNDGVSVGFEGINNDSFAEDSIDSWALAPDAVEEIQAGLATAEDVSLAPIANAVVAALGGSEITYAGPVAEGGDITLYSGSDYTGSKSLVWTITGWTGASVNGEAVTFALMDIADYQHDSITHDLSITTGTAAQTGSTITLTVPVTAVQTAALLTYPPHEIRNYRMQARSNTTLQTMMDATCTVRKRTMT